MADARWQARRRRLDAQSFDVSFGDRLESSGQAANGPRPRVYGVLGPDGRAWVAIDGEVLVVGSGTDGRRPATHRGAGDDLSSPMPATVVTVLVAEGDNVRTGDVLVLLEAMKMELPLRAPHAGRVTAVHCVPGTLVQPGVVLVTIDETP